MKISGTEYNLPRKTLEIYLSGCLPPNCPGCHNKELWDFEIGNDWASYKKSLTGKLSGELVKSVWILGGDPLDQDHSQLVLFLNFLNEFNITIWVWTKYDFLAIPKEILNKCDYIKAGEYREELLGYTDELTGIHLASTNQKIYKLR